MIRPILYLIMVFMSGVVVAINLSRLVPTNEAYVAAWWKVAFAIALAVMFGCMALGKATDE